MVPVFDKEHEKTEALNVLFLLPSVVETIEEVWSKEDYSCWRRIRLGNI